MVRRRDYTPLGGATRGSWKNSPYFASFVGVLVGVGLGSIVTLSLFAWLPRDSPVEGVAPDHDLPNFQTLHSALPDVRNRVIEPPAIKSVDGYNTSNEGTRVISDFERYGGWRLTPEVLEIAKRHPKAKIVSHKSPLLLVFENFLSKEETEHLVGIASTHMGRSKVVADKTKGAEVSQARTSFGAWLSNQWRDSVVVDIEKRIHDTVGIPHEFGEGMYVLRYEKTQKYDPHNDNCARRFEQPKEPCMNFTKRARGPRCGEGQGGASCGDRAATFIVYLRSPTKGGGTVFPNAEMSRQNVMKNRRAGAREFGSGPKGWYCQDPSVLKVNPQPGDGVLFWDYIPRPDIVEHNTYPRSGGHDTMNSDTEAYDDPAALHGGCPVEEGEKWIATRWIRTSRFS